AIRAAADALQDGEEEVRGAAVAALVQVGAGRRTAVDSAAELLLHAAGEDAGDRQQAERHARRHRLYGPRPASRVAASWPASGMAAATVPLPGRRRGPRRMRHRFRWSIAWCSSWWSLGRSGLMELQGPAGARRRAVGLGTGGLRAAAPIALAIGMGYRLVDTAAFYGNEEAVGQAIRQEVSAGRARREELTVTTKVWWTELGFRRSASSLEASLERLGLDFVDLVLVHWPGRWLSSDRQAQREGRVGAIGVSNYLTEKRQMARVSMPLSAPRRTRHLDELFEYCDVPPAVNQIELHPYRQQRQLAAECHARGVRVQAYSPLASGGQGLLRDPVLRAIAARAGASPAQLVLRWLLQRGVAPISKSGSPARLGENLAAASGAPLLSAADLAEVDALDRGSAGCCDPTAALLGGEGVTSPARIA
ncbi:unnamed protein product, partial [Prorocentrum cordatum]